MNAQKQLPQRYALILDPKAIRKALSKIESLNLPRRECHPLDKYTGKKANLEWLKIDAEIDREMSLLDADVDEADAWEDAPAGELASDERNRESTAQGSTAH